MQSLALDYEEPIVVPDSPPLMNAPSLSIPKDTSFASALGFEKIGLSTNTQIDRQNEIDDNESKIYPQSSSIRSTRASTREAKLKDALARTEENLKVALQDAQDAKNEIEALKKAEEVRNESFLVVIHAAKNALSHYCRAVQGRFTPIPNYACQSHVDEMLKGKTPTNRQPLQWPRQFRSGPVALPYPPSNGTFPVLHPRAPAPPVFPIYLSTYAYVPLSISFDNRISISAPIFDDKDVSTSRRRKLQHAVDKIGSCRMPSGVGTGVLCYWALILWKRGCGFGK
ncbi:hypothetical protein C8R41DRAFT_866944 [Lentinula lateritia]|uniref:Uncharacterized protein n=1 Tax=Lentinula lateritia TaxID=40482 RepID=A0ABQ8VGA4_9AGAR|nr:hypothetical protein C8R41DRAFT_866944 [Lentinula lateritia]